MVSLANPPADEGFPHEAPSKESLPQLETCLTSSKFDLAARFQACTLEDNEARMFGFGDAFSLSPLSSPESTPPASPRGEEGEERNFGFDDAFCSSPLPISEPTPPASPHKLSSSTLPVLSPPSLPRMMLAHLPSTSDLETGQFLDSLSFTQATPTHNHTGTPLKKTRDRKAAKKAISHDRRKKTRAGVAFGHYVVRKKVLERYVHHAESVHCEYDTETASVQNTGFAAKDDGRRPRKTYSLDELVGETSKFNFQLKKWNGRDPTSVTDASNRIIALLGGHPEVPEWPQLHQQAAQAMEERRLRCYVRKKKRKPRRGQFVALQTGISHGGGQKRPCNVKNHPKNEEVLKELNELAPFKRMAGFASACMASWAPDLHQYYVDHMGALHTDNSSLKPVFSSSVFSAATYNFGPQTVCFAHRDFSNLTFGWCAVWALGSFDYTKGSHLVLWECRLVIEFPPGSVILLPSSIITHSNVRITPTERRYSFTTYSAGALFHWVSNGFVKAEDYYATLTPDELEVEKKKNARRWLDGLALLPRQKAVQIS